MSVTMRVLLIIGAVLTCIFVLRRIRRSQMLMSDSVFWIVMSVLLVVVSIFPRIAGFAARILGVQSPANLVFLMISFILIVKLFFLSADVSLLKRKLTDMAQEVALRLKEKEDAEENRP